MKFAVFSLTLYPKGRANSVIGSDFCWGDSLNGLSVVPQLVSEDSREYVVTTNHSDRQPTASTVGIYRFLFVITILASFLLTLMASGVVRAFSQELGASGTLSFDGGSTFKVVGPNTPLSALYQGVGHESDVVWLVARVERASQLSNEELSYQVIQEAEQPAFVKSASVSPNLPTRLPGIYLVKVQGFSVNQLPPIHYQVSGQISAQLAAPQNISLLTPSAGEKVTRDYVFQWVSQNNAPIYRYELFVSRSVPYFGARARDDEGDLSSVHQYGSLLSGQERAFQIGTMATPAVAAASSIYWRVVGLDIGGNTVGVSRLQRVTVQP